MPNVELTPAERRDLEMVAEKAHSSREVRRAQALLWLADGESVAEVAQRALWTVQAIYGLVKRFRERKDQPVAQRVADAPRCGRPGTKMAAVQAALEKLMPESPQIYGYRGACWTVPMLKGQIDRMTGLQTSPLMIRRALKRLGYRYKRPRFVLARRSDTWRQAKGGSSAGLSAVFARAEA